MRTILISTSIFLLNILFSRLNVLAETWEMLLDGKFYEGITNSTLGILAGENDSRTYLQPYNGVLLSTNLGKTWQQIGLNKRGVTDIFYNNGKIYAATYYQKDGNNGVFTSQDKGASWQHIGPNVSTSVVYTNSGSIFIGSFSHGLWVSVDNGATFVQKLGSGFYGPKILTVRSNTHVAIAGTPDKTYRSLDGGGTWNEIQVLAGKQIAYVTFVEDDVFIGTFSVDGIYKSTDLGVTWVKVQTFGTAQVGGLFSLDNHLYAGKYDFASQTYSIYKSIDKGESWENTGLNLTTTGTATKLDFIYAHPSLLLAAVNNRGIYKMEISKPTPELFRFLQTPWESAREYELIDKINSFFDHTYPLLGYATFTEPKNYINTTQNFWGDIGGIPQMYYSSHSGIDFDLAYNTSVVAPASGTASYYFCPACGYSIKIDHKNGYQTVYEHLQKDFLITNQAPVDIQTGEIIGKVGLSGNTTGPHLHFEVITDSNDNGSFSDDFPQGRVDPFGWLNTEFSDPWTNFYWKDIYGEHVGAKSKYLWHQDIPNLNVTISKGQNEYTFTTENKTLDLSLIEYLTPYNIEYKPYSRPILTGNLQNLKYIPNTSFLLNILDTVKNKITSLNAPIHILIKLEDQDIQNVMMDSLSLYNYDSLIKEWKPLVTSFNPETSTLSALTTNLGQFAVFATPIDTMPPNTQISVSGEIQDDWYITSPIISLISLETDTDETFYSLDDGITWNEYIEPVTILKNGFVWISYRSSDINGNFEPTQKMLLKVNYERKNTKNVSVKDTTFTIQSNNNTTAQN